MLLDRVLAADTRRVYRRPMRRITGGPEPCGCRRPQCPAAPQTTQSHSRPCLSRRALSWKRLAQRPPAYLRCYPPAGMGRRALGSAPRWCPGTRPSLLWHRRLGRSSPRQGLGPARRRRQRARQVRLEMPMPGRPARPTATPTPAACLTASPSPSSSIRRCTAVQCRCLVVQPSEL